MECIVRDTFGTAFPLERNLSHSELLPVQIKHNREPRIYAQLPTLRICPGLLFLLRVHAPQCSHILLGAFTRLNGESGLLLSVGGRVGIAFRHGNARAELLRFHWRQSVNLKFRSYTQGLPCRLREEWRSRHV